MRRKRTPKRNLPEDVPHFFLFQRGGRAAEANILCCTAPYDRAEGLITGWISSWLHLSVTMATSALLTQGRAAIAKRIGCSSLPACSTPALRVLQGRTLSNGERGDECPRTLAIKPALRFCVGCELIVLSAVHPICGGYDLTRPVWCPPNSSHRFSQTSSSQIRSYT